MTTKPRDPTRALKLQVTRLKERLAEAEATLEAIRHGHVDALVVGEQVYTLEGTDHRYRQLVETMNEGALLLTGDGVIVYANARFAAMVNQPLERIIGSPMCALAPPVWQPLLEAFVAGRGGKDAKVELELVVAGDGRIPVYLSATASWNRDEALTSVIATDLTDQKRNHEMVAAERLTSMIVDQAAEGVVVCDLSGRVIRASRIAHTIAAGNPLLRPFGEGVPAARHRHLGHRLARGRARRRDPQRPRGQPAPRRRRRVPPAVGGAGARARRRDPRLRDSVRRHHRSPPRRRGAPAPARPRHRRPRRGRGGQPRARTSSSPCSATSCATRWRRSAPRSS